MHNHVEDPIEAGNEHLITLLRDEIVANGGQIGFAQFMELALYHPLHGYYMAETRRPGRGGDFITAPEATPHFGHTIARQMVEFWERLGRPASWAIREYGAGIGGLAYDIMAGLDTESPDAFEALTYHLVELNPGQQIEALNAMSEVGLAEKIVIESPATASDSIVGVILANEVADALPVHRLLMTESGWEEAYVGWRPDGFEWTPGKVSPEASDAVKYLETEGIEVAVGSIVDVCPMAAQWFRQVVDGLERGYVLIIDYGYPASELYQTHRLDGTIRGYAGHTATDDPFVRIGHQDLTAHVDFTALRRAGEASGLIHAGYTTQGAFLSSLGFGDVLPAMQMDPETSMEEYKATQAIVLRLIDPGGFGRFGVMIMGRDAPIEPPLRGFMQAAPEF